MLKKNRILIVGSNGFIGRHLLTKLGADVGEVEIGLLLNDKKEKINDGKYLRYYFDGGYESIKNAIDQFEPHVIINLATKYIRCVDHHNFDDIVVSNLKLPFYIASICKNKPVKVLIFGTIWQDQKISSVYVATKEMQQKIMETLIDKDSKVTITQLILGDTYGFADYRNKLVEQLIVASIEGKEIALTSGHQPLNLLHVDEIVDAILISLEIKNCKFNTFSVLADNEFILKDLIKMLNSKTDNKLKVNFGDVPYRDGEVMHLESDHKRLPNWRPRYNVVDKITEIYEVRSN